MLFIVRGNTLFNVKFYDNTFVKGIVFVIEIAFYLKLKIITKYCSILMNDINCIIPLF